MSLFLFFFNDTATTEIYTLSLHDALPISRATCFASCDSRKSETRGTPSRPSGAARKRGSSARSTSPTRSEEHTSELQSQSNLVCRLLLEKKKNTNQHTHPRSRPPPTHKRH